MSRGDLEPTPEEPLRGGEGQGGSGSSPPMWIPNRGVQGEPVQKILRSTYIRAGRSPRRLFTHLSRNMTFCSFFTQPDILWSTHYFFFPLCFRSVHYIPGRILCVFSEELRDLFQWCSFFFHHFFFFWNLNDCSSVTSFHPVHSLIMLFLKDLCVCVP